MAESIFSLIEEKNIAWVDLRFTDLIGKEQHVTFPASAVDSDFFDDGKMFDGSSIQGWKGINESDMILKPDPASAQIDPFTEQPTLIVRCDIIEPASGEEYSRDPRSVARRAETYLRSTGIGDEVFFGPEPEFFLFDSVRWGNDSNHSFFRLDAYDGEWSSGLKMSDDLPNLGHRARVKGGYFPVQPVDNLHEVRTAMCDAMESMGLVIELHHHEVASSQCEIGVRFNSLTTKADELQVMKYCVHNVAERYGKSATFMPKPVVGDNGSGMHCHQSINKAGVNIFSGDGYGGLSDEAMYYIGGIIKHARAINAFANPSTNSYKRLVPGFEAPVMLAYSARNRSASIRIPYIVNPKARRIEVRFPDPMANPYLAFSAMLMAGLDGIENKILPGDPADKDLYDLPPEELKDYKTVCSSLDQALEALDADRAFLTKGGVFSDDLISSYIELKQNDVDRIRMATHPVEFDMYYSL